MWLISDLRGDMAREGTKAPLIGYCDRFHTQMSREALERDGCRAVIRE